MGIYAYGNTNKCEMEINEDSYIVNKIGDYYVFIIADANGGIKGLPNFGTMAVSIMYDYLAHFIKSKTSLMDIYNNLEAAMYTVSRSMLSVNSVDEKYSNIYVSLSVVIIEDVSLNMVFASIGNTEIKLIRNGKINRLNKLFSEAYDLFQKNEISEEELYVHPKRAILTSALGVFNNFKVDIAKMQLMKEDILLLSTDGIYRCMTPMQVLEKLASVDDACKGVEEILKYCNEEKCPDNCTVICSYIYDDNGVAIERENQQKMKKLTEDSYIYNNHSYSNNEEAHQESGNNYSQNKSTYDPYGSYYSQPKSKPKKRKNYLFNS